MWTGAQLLHGVHPGAGRPRSDTRPARDIFFIQLDALLVWAGCRTAQCCMMYGWHAIRVRGK
eukprot:7141432-Prorocentrum_lima.AAC.1